MSIDVRGQVAEGFLTAGIPQVLVDEVLDSFEEAKRRFHLGDFRPNAVEGGRFTESVLRVLEWQTSATFTPLGQGNFKADTVMNRLSNMSPGDASDSVRLHIPRALRLIYDVRNKRNTAHLAGGINPNIQDATLVISTMSWVLAELVRTHHSVTPTEAQGLIESIVTRQVPMIEVFNGRPRILKDLITRDHCLTLLYWSGPQGVAVSELRSWLPRVMRANLARTLQLLHTRHLVHLEDSHAQLTALGFRDVEARNLISPL